MLRKHFVAIGIAMATALLFAATTQYPGGSQHDKNAVGFNWQHNYLCNLLNEKAMNEMGNTAHPWAVAGMFFLCIAVAIFFIRFSKKIPHKSGTNAIKYAGAGAMIAAVFTATSFHDSAITISGTLLLLSLFYIAVFVFKSRLRWLKIYSVICLLVFCVCNYVYYTDTYLEWLPILQKVTLGMILVWILALEYFTEREDFRP
jgi:amino acid transporter